MNNETFSKIAGIPNQKLFELELEFLKEIDFDLFINLEGNHFQDYKKNLLQFYLKERINENP